MGLKHGVIGDKKGFFFSVDAFMALVIMLLAVGIVSTSFISSRPTYQLSNNANDLINVMSELRIDEMNSSVVRQMILNGSIIRPNQSVMMQIGEFYSYGRTDLAALLFQEFSDMVPLPYETALYINSQNIFSTSDSEPVDLLSAKSYVSGFEQNETLYGFSSRASLIIGDVSRAQHIFYGGYIGYGNISSKLSLPSDFIIEDCYLELDIASSFDLFINGVFSGSFSPSTPEKEADTFLIDPAYYSNFQPGLNIVSFSSSSMLSIGGGYLEVDYRTEDIFFSETEYADGLATSTYHFDNIDGLINIYDSFYIPGSLVSMESSLDYSTDFPLMLTLGSETVYNSSQLGDVSVIIPNSTLSSFLDFASLSRSNIPLRLGHIPGNVTVSNGTPVDVILTTDISNSMDSDDMPDAPGMSRLDVAKEVDHDFVGIFLNSSYNRLGLVSYHASIEPGQSEDLTNSKMILDDKIDHYHTKGPNTCFSSAVIDSRSKLLAQSDPSRSRIIIVMSDGTANRCYYTPTACGEEAAKVEAIQSACETYDLYNITIHSIGFGSSADNATLKAISDCGHGNFYWGQNYTALKEIYSDLAYELLISSLGFSGQAPNVTNIHSDLHDSFIRFTYVPDINPPGFGEIIITEETPHFGNSVTQGHFGIPAAASLREAYLTSYSGSLWTSRVSIDSGSGSVDFFDIDGFGDDYILIGDPFVLQVPLSLASSDNDVILKTSFNISAESGGSPSNRAIYSYSLPAVSDYTSVLPEADGCVWFLEFEDGTNLTIAIPADYAGTDACSFGSYSYDSGDAIDVAVFDLLGMLDFDGDGLLDIIIGPGDLGMTTLTISEIPSLWGPAVIEVRSWQ